MPSMQEITMIYAMSSGVPDVAKVEWHPAALEMAGRANPFTGAPILLPTWEPMLATVDGHERARIFSDLDLTTEPEWAEARKIFARHASGMHEGILMEFWASIIGRAEARAAWKPQWISRDRQLQLIAFPPAVTGWVARPTEPTVDEVVLQWSELPYLQDAAATEALAVAKAWCHALSSVARIAVDMNAALVALASGYVGA